MKQILFFSAFLILAVACSKSEPEKPCEVNKTTTITISNSSSNPYDVYVDGIYKTRVYGNAIQDITVNEGNNRAFYAEQVSGYVFYPTTRSSTINVLRCTPYTWQIP